ncbi:MAG: ribulose-phosphate 3-epimerase [Planctomycetia bacterium]|nr:ribulose-phosphate 3-epimerase [Planctomycetia bacterium]
MQHTHVIPQAGRSPDPLARRLDGGGPVVLPALLLCDFGHLAREVERLEQAGAAALHLDVMDGRFVPQLTYGLVVVEAVRRAARVPIEVHLMIEQPERTIDDYARAGADILTVHVEGLADPAGTLRAIAAAGPRAHLAVSPGTPVDRVLPHLDHCDGVLVMSVEPGYGGQRFDDVALGKLAALAEERRRRGDAFRLGVDGGISTDTVGAVAAAGAELIVAGSAVIRSRDYAHAIAELEALARAAA